MNGMENGRKWKNRLWVQLGLSILAVNLAVLLSSFAFQYRKIRDILLDYSARSTIEWFRRSEGSLEKFYGQVNVVMGKLLLDSDVRRLAGVGHMTEADRVYYASQVLRNFSVIRSNYQGIAAISYYGNDGFVLQNGDEVNNIYYRKQEQLPATGCGASGKLTWAGGYTDWDFGLSVKKDEEPQYYISVCRDAVKGDGKLILHYDLDYFLDIFSIEEGMGEEIYITDDMGRIVAAGDVSLIGEERIFSGGEPIEEGIEKYIVDGEEGKLQAVVYCIPLMGWQLVNEKLVSEVTKDTEYMRNILLATCLFCGGVSFAFSMFWISRLLKPLNLLVSKMRRVREGELGSVVDRQPKNELGMLVENFNGMSVELKKMFEQNRKIEQERQELEMKALRSQINPHLIYNTLNTIKWMALVNNEGNIARSITLLSDFLEPVFRKGSPVCTMGEELEYVKNYIAIMNLRSGEKYALEVEVPEEYMACRMIRFLLQPVVENSIRHGFEESMSGTIRISMEREGENGVIRVEDNGKGIEPRRLEEISLLLKEGVREEGQEEGRVGIDNVNRRIRLYYGERYGLTIQNRPEGGTVVTLRIRFIR